MASGLLCLKWNNHSSAFDKLLNNLHLRDVYSDGTIVCHGKFYPVHRFVLSTCSEYFEEIFSQSFNMKCKHPFIIVKDIHPPQMEALLNYMYRGEVNVPQEMLPELIKAAEAFKIKGLAVPDDEPPPSKSKDRKRTNASSSPSSLAKKSRRLEDRSIKSHSETEDNISRLDTSVTDSTKKLASSDSKDTEELFFAEPQPSSVVKSEPIDPSDYNEGNLSGESNPVEEFLAPKEHTVKEEQSFDSFVTSDPFPAYDEDNAQSADEQFDMAQSSSWDNSQGFEEENLEENESSQRVYNFPHTSNMDEDSTSPVGFNQLPGHTIQDKIDITTRRRREVKQSETDIFVCPLCPYRASRNQHLKIHLLTHTRERPYPCPFCPYKALRNEHLKVHMSKHTGLKPHRCPYCSYRGAQKHHLLYHIESKHSRPL